ncbi:16S rRNA (cytosine967-C5)-methyltransferase [Pseudosulfitobacter pseudonitzschiae]|uniref:SAM-dependent methlyltransferase n=1 Tax=Pseudosulfitobacter pseudonitzschiae TaxID=1402135 RepID=A0A073J4A2_9RHOB|nr:SAM-dependent methyltransferase [Pseudosulfitobacter pseudonitzschiae]KEJ97448.1 SAM-dependent methlyltransferase [Pseudosulfitobacter pseudonitzschiae]QKS08741.1 RsmB/NOP family class I SAM-dependent RNA methyltransferase [Pseudosulfitobacter pseudonitzschiae]SHE70366.1 16S rRNA (cytosine967-C5)-methyltransferase [Pseudosulfitobacter pseudonitzschiae]
MTPGARVAASIEIIDDILAGQAAEQALTRWARSSRFAGSKDRAAVRDLVFAALRTWRSDAVLGGGEDGRARMIGRLRAEGADIEALFDDAGHAPAPLTEEEHQAGGPPTEIGDRWNLPEWLLPQWQAALGDAAEVTALIAQDRAPITLRVNTRLCSVDDVVSALESEQVLAEANSLSPTALTVLSNPRRVRQSQAYIDGWIEMQDAASQAVVDAIPGGTRALDYCAGGGGKALALAARGFIVWAHDIAPGRMADIPDRAERAAVQIRVVAPDQLPEKEKFDVVLCDAPCSGSGAWRRSPEGKWALTQERLDELNSIQDEILDTAMTHLATGGTLVYVTCSVLKCENEDRVAAFLERHSGWTCDLQKRWDISAEGDGFFTAHLTRA